jgi:hypothetical protein
LSHPRLQSPIQADTLAVRVPGQSNAVSPSVALYVDTWRGSKLIHVHDLAEEMVEHHQWWSQKVTRAGDDPPVLSWQGRVQADSSNVFIQCDSAAPFPTWNAGLPKCEEKPRSFGCPCPWTRAVRFQDVAGFHSVKTRERQQRVATAFVEAKFAIQNIPLCLVPRLGSL